MAEQPTTEQPYTDVEQIARDALARSGWTMALDEGMPLVQATMDALAAAGRLLPEGASPYADGYAAAVAALRDDDRYRNWWTSLPGDDPEWGYWKRTPRRELADYLEAAGPVPINEESTDGR